MTQTYLQEFTAFSANGAGRGPAWVAPVRRAAIERFGALGFPTPKNEDWHFTSVSPIAERVFSLASRETRHVSAEQYLPFLFGQAAWPVMVFVNGRYAAPLSTEPGESSGIRVMDLARAWQENDALLEQHLTKVASYDRAAFTALNTAFMYDGAVIHIGANADAPYPLHLLFVSTGDVEGRVSHPRNLIVAERDSRATVIESYVALGNAPYFTNGVTEVTLREGATFTHLKVQRESEQAYHVGTVQVEQGRDTHFLQFSFASGAALSRTNVYTMLNGAGCGATLNGLYMVDGTQHVDHQTRIEHAQPNTFSREMYKGILDGASHGVFNGQVYVRPVAQQTDGKQENNNLLLSRQARVDTKPQLEIYANDVKCTHGATVGRLDDTALFYMKSRGIGQDTARKLLTYAFAAGVLEHIELEPVREELERLTLNRFTGTGSGQ